MGRAFYQGRPCSARSGATKGLSIADMALSILHVAFNPCSGRAGLEKADFRADAFTSLLHSLDILILQMRELSTKWWSSYTDQQRLTWTCNAGLLAPNSCPLTHSRLLLLLRSQHRWNSEYMEMALHKDLTTKVEIHPPSGFQRSFWRIQISLICIRNNN